MYIYTGKGCEVGRSADNTPVAASFPLSGQARLYHGLCFARALFEDSNISSHSLQNYMSIALSLNLPTKGLAFPFSLSENHTILLHDAHSLNSSTSVSASIPLSESHALIIFKLHSLYKYIHPVHRLKCMVSLCLEAQCSFPNFIYPRFHPLCDTFLYIIIVVLDIRHVILNDIVRYIFPHLTAIMWQKKKKKNANP